MHVNMFQVTWVVAIGLDQQKVGHKKNDFFFRWELILHVWGVECCCVIRFGFGFKFIKFCIHYCLKMFLPFSILVMTLLRALFLCVHCRMLWKNIFSCIGYLVSIKYFYCIIGSEVTRSDAGSQILHQMFHLVRKCFPWIFHIVWHCYH